jgi:hypothetical protein
MKAGSVAPGLDKGKSELIRRRPALCPLGPAVDRPPGR